MYNSSEERINEFMAGNKALSGKSISEVAKKHNMSWYRVKKAKEKVKDTLDTCYNTSNKKVKTLIITSTLVVRLIIGAMLICRASTEQTKELLSLVLGIEVSIGKISNTIQGAAEIAKTFNESISLENVKTGVHDEIFQAGIPVLVGVEPKSTYIYLMTPSDTRDGDAWSLALLDKEDQNLELETTVNDAGTGMKKGITEVYPDIQMQSDIYHAEIVMSKAVISLENGAYRAIKEEYKHEKKCLKALFKKNLDTSLADYDKSVMESNQAIDKYETAYIINTWVKEAFQIGGALYEERVFILDFCISELKKVKVNNEYLEKAIKYLENQKNTLLTFVLQAGEGFKKIAKNREVDEEVLISMWNQKRYSTDSVQYNLVEAEIGKKLMEKYDGVRTEFETLLTELVRASSIVECQNGRIRQYLYLKRAVNNKFMDLLQFYLNTHKYRRSRVKDRKGKSPLELLTNKEHPNFFELLGY